MIQSKILLADPHAITRKGLAQIIRETPDFELSDQATNKQELLEKLDLLNLDIVLLDVSTSDETDWQVILEIKAIYPDLPVIVLNFLSDEKSAIPYYKAGASGYLTKECSEKELVTAIRKVVSGGKYVSSKFAETLVAGLEDDANRPLHDTLSPREFQVLVMISSGKTLTQVAKELNLGIPTIGTYRRRILEKLGLENTAQMIRYSFENKII